MAAGRRSITILVGVSALLLCVQPSAAYAEPPPPPPDADGPIEVRPVDPGGVYGGPAVDAGVQSPGSPAAPAAPGGGSPGGGGGPRCEYIRGDDEWAVRYAATHVLPPPAPGEHIYEQVCNGSMIGWVILGPGGAPALPSPAQLAQQAAAQLSLSLPVPRHSPDLRLVDGRSGIVVGAATWMWTEPASFRPLSRRVAAGPVWARVTARPVGLEFDPGDGSPVVACAGPGTPFDRSRHGVYEASPDCGFVYTRSSFGRPDDQVSATYAIRWQVSWVGATATGPAQGTLPELVSRATSSFVVAEAQALRTQ